LHQGGSACFNFGSIFVAEVGVFSRGSQFRTSGYFFPAWFTGPRGRDNCRIVTTWCVADIRGSRRCSGCRSWLRRGCWFVEVVGWCRCLFWNWEQARSASAISSSAVTARGRELRNLALEVCVGASLLLLIFHLCLFHLIEAFLLTYAHVDEAPECRILCFDIHLSPSVFVFFSFVHE